jgi:hypothetical protein
VTEITPNFSAANASATMPTPKSAVVDQVGREIFVARIDCHHALKWEIYFTKGLSYCFKPISRAVKINQVNAAAVEFEPTLLAVSNCIDGCKIFTNLIFAEFTHEVQRRLPVQHHLGTGDVLSTEIFIDN